MASIAEWERACQESLTRSRRRRQQPQTSIVSWVLFAFAGIALGVAVALVWLYEAGSL